MGNDVAVRKNSYIANTDDYFAAIAAEAESFRDGGGISFMKFDGNTGEYSYGSDNEELKLGSLLALNMQSYKRGWICWVDGEVKAEIMTPVHEGAPPKKTELEDFGPYDDGDGWSEQYTIEMRVMEEPFTNLLFQANNSSKRRAFEAVLKDFAKGYKQNPGCAPVIEIDEREFEAKDPKNPKKKYRKHAPEFKIVDWKPLDELAALVEGSPDDYEDEAPKSRTSRSRDEDEAPKSERRAASRSRDEDEEPAPRNSREESRASRNRRDEEEDERPRRSARAQDNDETEDEAEDERPARTTSSRRSRFDD